MKQQHILEVLPENYDPLVLNKKTIEIRKNNRNFQVDDWVKFLEYDCSGLTGNYINAIITTVTPFPQKEGYVMFSIQMTSFGYHNNESINRITNN